MAQVTGSGPLFAAALRLNVPRKIRVPFSCSEKSSRMIDRTRLTAADSALRWRAIAKAHRQGGKKDLKARRADFASGPPKF